MNKKTIRKLALIFVIFFSIYFMLGSIFSCYIKTNGFYNMFFGTDSHRVFIDLTQLIAPEHYRTTVHPLFIIMFQPIVRLLDIIIKNNMLSAIILQSLISATSITFIYMILEKINTKPKLTILLTIISGLSFGQFVFNSTLETFAFAQLFLIILFYYVIGNDNRKFTKKDIIILTLLGIANLGITLTNFFVYVLVVCSFFLLNKKEKISNKIYSLLLVLILSTSISVVLSEIQYVVFKGANLFFSGNISEILYTSPSEINYIEPFGFNSIKNQIRTIFGYGFMAPNIILTKDVYNLKLTFSSLYLPQKIIIVLNCILLLSLLIIFIKKNYKKLLEHKFFVLLFLAFVFNFALHSLYGNSEGFLYILHYQFLLIIMLAYLINNSNEKTQKISTLYMGIYLLIMIIFNIIGVYNMYNISVELCGTYSTFPLMSIVVIIIALLMIFILAKLTIVKKITLLIICIATGILLISFYKTSNKNFIYEEYKEEYNTYITQIESMYKNYGVKIAFDNDDTNTFFFGMGNRKKIIYKDGRLYDIFKKIVIEEFDVKKEMIIPNEYTVIVKTKDDKIIKIYENETGIYIKEKDEVKNLTPNTKKINLPEFKNHKYSEVLKVLHQEILFNIKDSVMTPNIINYENAWYRDAMMGAMVLNETNNTDIIKPWVDKIEKIYDEQNGHKEADNLGELLYLLHVTGSKNEISKDIIKEIEEIKKQHDGSLAGYTDSMILSYYPTVIAEYASKLSGKDLKLTIPKEYDEYAKLTWYYKDDIQFDGAYDVVNYPYLGWANYNMNNKGQLYILDDIYPLSYEKGAAFANFNLTPEILGNYKEQKISPTHVWAAAEQFMMLLEE